MTTNDLMMVTRASVYFGEYKKARKSGYKTWCKLVLYYTPMGKDPITGELYPLEGVEGHVSLFIADSAAENLISIVKNDGEKMKDVSGNAYTIAVSKLPRSYKYAFTERWELTGEWKTFDSPMVKVDLNGKPIRRKSDNKTIVKTSVFVSYWEGKGVELTTLSKEARMKSVLQEWRAVNLPTLEKDEDEKKSEDKPENEEHTGA